MKIEIEFHPNDGPVQTLYADLPVKDVERLEADTRDPAKADNIVQIPSQTERNGTTNNWMFHLGLIKIHRV